jgi:hypothetical protein
MVPDGEIAPPGGEITSLDGETVYSDIKATQPDE